MARDCNHLFIPSWKVRLKLNIILLTYLNEEKKIEEWSCGWWESIHGFLHDFIDFKLVHKLNNA